MDKQGSYEKEYRKGDYNFSNHYNQKLNKCLILINHFKDDSNLELIESDTILYNVYENNSLGVIRTVGSLKNFCEVSNQSCEDQGEFAKLVKPYMEEWNIP